MANQYLTEIHQYLNRKIGELEHKTGLARKNNAVNDTCFYDGQLKELYDLQQLLKDKYNLTTQNYG